MEKEDLVLAGVVTLAHAWQLGMAASEVGLQRRKHKINPPITNGPPDFIRALRAQQNGLEFGVLFQLVLWTSAIFGHQVPAAILGCYYLYARHYYVKGYIRSTDDRLQPFYQSVRAIRALVAVAAVGLGNTLLKTYFGIDAFSMIKEKIFPA